MSTPDYAAWFAQQAREEAAERFEYLRTREFTATITDDERRELAAMVAERDDAHRLRSIEELLPAVTYREVAGEGGEG